MYPLLAIKATTASVESLLCFAWHQQHCMLPNSTLLRYTKMALKAATESAGLLGQDVLHVHVTLYP